MVRRMRWIVKGRVSESNESVVTKATKKNEVGSEE